MPCEAVRLKPWQIFRAALKHLGPGAMATIFPQSDIRALHLLGQDPELTENRTISPLESIHKMFSRMDEIGRSDLALAGLDYLKTAVDDDCAPPPREPITTIEQEILRDFSAICSLQNGIRLGLEFDEIDNLRKEAIAGINRTFATYIEETRKGERGADR